MKSYGINEIKKEEIKNKLLEKIKENDINID